MIPLNNWILVELSENCYKIPVGGIEFILNRSFEPIKHTENSGIVITTCNDLQQGDKVFFSYVQTLKAMERSDPHNFIINGKLCILVQYESIAIVKRGEELIPINNYVLLAPYYEKNIFGTRVSKTYGTVRYVGKDSNLAVGSVVVGDTGWDIPTQYELHSETEILCKTTENIILAVMEC